MWMLYSEQHWPLATDLRSAIKRLKCHLGALEDHCSHQLNHTFCPEEENRLQEREKAYGKGKTVLSQFSDGKCTINDVYMELKKISW